MKTEVIKNLVEYFCSRMESYDKKDVFIGQLLMIRYLFEHLNEEKYKNLLSDKSLYADVERQLLDIVTHIKNLCSIYSENSDKVINTIKKEYNDIIISIKTIKQKIEKHESLLGEIKTISEQKNRKINSISEQILEMLESKNIACIELYNEYHNKIAVLRESVDALLKMEEDKKENNAHLEENRHVLEKLCEAGITKEGDAPQKAFELEIKAGEILKEYDGILNNLLEFANKEKEEIKRRQKIVKETNG
jgi:hypothetical protein